MEHDTSCMEYNGGAIFTKEGDQIARPANRPLSVDESRPRRGRMAGRGLVPERDGLRRPDI